MGYVADKASVADVKVTADQLNQQMKLGIYKKRWLKEAAFTL